MPASSIANPACIKKTSAPQVTNHAISMSREFEATESIVLLSAVSHCKSLCAKAVSYTHLTLPTICSV
eukprot:2475740-Rhodomonas_salina.1